MRSLAAPSRRLLPPVGALAAPARGCRAGRGPVDLLPDPERRQSWVGRPRPAVPAPCRRPRPVRHGPVRQLDAGCRCRASEGSRLARDGRRERPDLAKSHAEPLDGQQRRRRPRPAAAAQRQAQGRADRQRHLRNGDARRGHRLPAPHDIHVVGVDGRVHLAAAAVAFRAARVGQHERVVRLQRRQRAGELGNRGGDRPVAHGAKRIYDAGHGRVAVGDIGFEHGGDIPGHDTHEQGLDVDLRPMRDGANQCTNATDYRPAATTERRRGR